MNAVPALDVYLSDLLSDGAPAHSHAARDEAAPAPIAEPADVVDVVDVIASATSELPRFAHLDDVPAIGDVPKPFGSDVDNAALLAALAADPDPTLDPTPEPEPALEPTPALHAGGASAPTTARDQTPSNAVAIDLTADLLAEFDNEFPDQAVDATPTSTAHLTADLLAEFDEEFPDQAVNAAPTGTAHLTADLLAEFDQEFPDQATDANASDAAPTTALATVDALLAEFDAEFPVGGTSVPTPPPSHPDFAAAVAEETEADAIQSRMPSPPIRVDAPPAPALPRIARNLVPPATLPAYAKPVFDLLQKQAQEQAQSPHGNDRRRASDRSSRWLRMRCDDQHYALELLKVQEVVLPATLLPLRGAARHMLGVMNLRGQVVPVIDLGMYLDRAPILDDSLTRIVVLEEQGEILGLRVSAVEDVTTLTAQQIEPPDNTRMCRITHPLFRGVARLAAQQTVILLDASELLR